MVTLRRVRVVDFHTHFYASAPAGSAPAAQRHPLIAAYDQERGARMAEEWDHGTSEPAARGEEEETALLARWSQEVEKYDLAHVVFLTGSSHENLSRVVGLNPRRFSGFCSVNLDGPDPLGVLQRGVEEFGLKGLKWFGPRLEKAWDDPSLKPVWQYMADRQLPMLIHFGPLGRAGGVVYGRNMSPLTIWPVGREFPEIPIVIPHFGCGYPQELLQLCWSLPNIYVDTSGSNQWMRWMPYPFDLDIAFKKFYETIGPKRIVFGTDSSWFPRGFSYRYLQDQYRSVKYLNLPEEEIEHIFARNAARLLKLDPAVYEKSEV